MKVLLIVIFSLLLIMYIFVHLVVYFYNERLVFNGRKLPQDHKFTFSLPHEEITLTASDGTKINSIFVKSAIKDKPTKGVVLYFHGNSTNLQWYGQYHRHFTSRGYDFFAIDYRGYGKSEGSPDSENLFADARMAYDFIAKDYPAENIVIFGKSLGSAFATYTAANRPAKLLMLETPYNKMIDVVATRFLPLWLPFRLKVPLENVISLPKVKCPVVVFHGTKDEFIAYRLAKQLKPAMKKNDVFITIKGAKHNDLEDFSKFQEGLDTYLK